MLVSHPWENFSGNIRADSGDLFHYSVEQIRREWVGPRIADRRPLIVCSVSHWDRMRYF
ncbi:MAG: hypothetical protein JWM11_6281 [Planctomycetaceae bacterium]|nr:hypothetical protein [Planctomycetaceae bacterium]